MEPLRLHGYNAVGVIIRGAYGMAEPEVEASWRAEFQRLGGARSATRSIAAVASPMN